jgi:hypothetical protein
MYFLLVEPAYAFSLGWNRLVAVSTRMVEMMLARTGGAFLKGLRLTHEAG